MREARKHKKVGGRKLKIAELRWLIKNNEATPYPKNADKQPCAGSRCKSGFCKPTCPPVNHRSPFLRPTRNKEVHALNVRVITCV